MSRPLLKKLGIKESDRILLINPPAGYKALLQEPFPDNIVHANDQLNFIHLFTNQIDELEDMLPKLQEQIVSNGMIWVSWYKKSAKIPTEINEDIIRNTALALKLVDVKVCSVSHEWSALKLVIRRNLR